MLKAGQLVRFAEEKQRYRIRAADKRYAICTKPMNALRTVLYTVVDFEQRIRGTENLIFCAGAVTDEQCSEMLERLATGKTQISRRNRIKLRITEVDGQPPCGECGGTGELVNDGPYAYCGDCNGTGVEATA